MVAENDPRIARKKGAVKEREIRIVYKYLFRREHNNYLEQASKR